MTGYRPSHIQSRTLPRAQGNRAALPGYNRSMWDSERFTKFICPLCGTNAYVPVTVKKPNGAWYQTEFFKCFGCSVMFTNPADFTKQKQHIRNPHELLSNYQTQPPVGDPEK